MFNLTANLLKHELFYKYKYCIIINYSRSGWKASSILECISPMSMWAEIPEKVKHPSLLCWHPFILPAVFVVHLFFHPTGVKWCLSMVVDEQSRSQKKADRHVILGLELGWGKGLGNTLFLRMPSQRHKCMRGYVCVCVCASVCVCSACLLFRWNYWIR